MRAGSSIPPSPAAMSASTTRRWASGIFPTPVLGHRRADEDRAARGPILQDARLQRAAAGRPRRLRSRRASAAPQYAKAVLRQLWGLPPALDMDYEKRVQAAIREIVAAGLAESAHDLSDGGLAVALAECSFGPAGIGAQIELESRSPAGVPAVPRRALAGPGLHGRSGQAVARHCARSTAWNASRRGYNRGGRICEIAQPERTCSGRCGSTRWNAAGTEWDGRPRRPALQRG